MNVSLAGDPKAGNTYSIATNAGNGFRACQNESLRWYLVNRFSKVADCHVSMTSGMIMSPVQTWLTCMTGLVTRNLNKNKHTLNCIWVSSMILVGKTSHKANYIVYGVTI
jgi:hypothetical protein